jgi:hypothetical protein
MRLCSLFLLGVAAFLPALAAAQSMTPEQRSALDAAERWLAPVDAGRYADAYAMAAEEFRAGGARAQWDDGIRHIRKDYGKLASRTAEKMGFAGEAPKPEAGLVPGMKVVILFASSFGARKAASEEMTMVYEKDGVWRVAGYYIR